MKNGKASRKNSAPPKKLTNKQIKALERIPFWVWDARSARWLKYYKALLQFIKREQHPHVPATKHVETMPDGEELDLSGWNSKQRSRYMKGELEKARIDKLNQIGFDWYAERTPKKRKARLEESDMLSRLDILSN